MPPIILPYQDIKHQCRNGVEGHLRLLHVRVLSFRRPVGTHHHEHEILGIEILIGELDQFRREPTTRPAPAGREVEDDVLLTGQDLGGLDAGPVGLDQVRADHLDHLGADTGHGRSGSRCLHGGAGLGGSEGRSLGDGGRGDTKDDGGGGEKGVTHGEYLLR